MTEELKAHMQNARDTEEVTYDLLTSLTKLNFKGETAPSMKKGLNQLKSNTN